MGDIPRGVYMGRLCEHLKAHSKGANSYSAPYELTAQGIGEYLNIPTAAAQNSLRKLKKHGLIICNYRFIPKTNGWRYVYIWSPEGVEYADMKLRDLDELRMHARKLNDVLERIGRRGTTGD